MKQVLFVHPFLHNTTPFQGYIIINYPRITESVRLHSTISPPFQGSLLQLLSYLILLHNICEYDAPWRLLLGTPNCSFYIRPNIVSAGQRHCSQRIILRSNGVIITNSLLLLIPPSHADNSKIGGQCVAFLIYTAIPLFNLSLRQICFYPSYLLVYPPFGAARVPSVSFSLERWGSCSSRHRD